MTRFATMLGLLAASCGLAHASVPGPIIDPDGDTFDAFGEGGPLLDIASLHVTYDVSNVHVTMTFYNEIAPASAEAANSIAGMIEFDTDQNADSGVSPLQNEFAPPFEKLRFGADFGCDLFSEIAHPGFIDIVSPNTFDTVATVAIFYTDTSLSFSVALNAIDDDGRLDFTGIIGTQHQPTDAMEVVGASVPAPSALALLVMAVTGGSCRRR